MKEVIVTRFDIRKNFSLGHIYVRKESLETEYIGVCIERGWRDNQSNISCVPAGAYPLKYEMSGTFKRELWEIYGVPGRSECKFHTANHWHQLNGCIAPGETFVHIDGDGDLDVSNSGDTLTKLHKALAGDTQARLRIVNL